MGFLEAAEEILKQAGQPLHYDEITKRAIAQGLIETQGKTPNRTMNAQLTTSIQRGHSPFVRVGRGVHLRGDMMTLPDVDQGVIITTSGFPAGAAAMARVRNAPPEGVFWKVHRKTSSRLPGEETEWRPSFIGGWRRG